MSDEVGRVRNDLGSTVAGDVWQSRAIAAVVLMAAAALIVQVALSPARLVYDEIYHLVGVNLLQDGMPFETFLRTPLESAAGPLYPVLHLLVAPLTGLTAPAIRWLNLGLLALTIWAMAYTVGARRYDRPLLRAAMFMAIPTVWVTAGMALTEIPASAALALSVAATAWAMTGSDDRSWRAWLGFASAGLLFGFGILGRQPYLPALIGFVAIAAVSPRFRFPALLAAALALALTVPIFVIWDGFIPPGQAKVGTRIVFEHGALGFAYAAVFVLLLAPRFFLSRWRWSVGLAAVAALVTAAVGGISLQIATGVAGHLPPWIAELFQLGASMVLVGAGAALILSAAINAWDRRDDRLFVLTIALAMGLAATPAFVSHQFSSRYVVAAFPFLLFAVQPYFRVSYAAAARLAFGAAFGFVSLQAYFG